MANRLASESSPYLLQHQHNPVDWYPWGPEALSRAQTLGMPIFLSIGYSACHWCHVMERESFENQAIAEIMNRHFVCIKVDREERPDLDQIYMQAVQLLTGRGGWPMSVFLTPDLKPFYGGTYWPPHAKMGMPGFDQVLYAVADAWQNKHESAVAQAENLVEHLQNNSRLELSSNPAPLNFSLLEAAGQSLKRYFDREHGGFGAAPKFPHTMDIRLALRLWYRTGRDEFLEIATHTLDKMAAGGIYDQLGGGFARYSVDERWLVPHFEKMLYDNALLLGCYADAYRITQKPRYRQVLIETADYILRDMTDPSGGFYSAEDADSEGVEGKFYVWSMDEIISLLGAERGTIFCEAYNVTRHGNFEGENILNLPQEIAAFAQLRGLDPAAFQQQLDVDRTTLLQARAQRTRPGLDDKVLLSWNAMMIDSLAQIAGLLQAPHYLEAATKAADFLLDEMRDSHGRLLHSWRQGQAKLPAYLDDYAHLIDSLITLYEVGQQPRFIEHAVQLAELMIQHFSDQAAGGFYYTADDHEQLLTRNKDYYDGSVPSGNSVAATALVRLAKLTGRDDFLESALQTMHSSAGLMEKSPTSISQMLLALDFYLGPVDELVVVQPEAISASPGSNSPISNQGVPLKDTLWLWQHYIPYKVVAHLPVPSSEIKEATPQTSAQVVAPLLSGKEVTSDTTLPVVYRCRNFSCEAPVSGQSAVDELWKQLARPRQTV